MGNCVSDTAHKYGEADDEKIIISHSSNELQGVMGGSINVEYISNGDDISNAGARSVRGLKVVISAKELRELLDSDVAEHNSRKAAFASLVLKKLSVKRESGGVMSTNSSCISTRSVQVKDNYYNSICHSWRPSLEDIPEDFTQD